MRKYFPILIAGWAAIIAGALLFNFYIFRKNSENLIEARSEAMFKLLVNTRLWNSNHSPVYVPVTGTMRPNPYLIHSMRDVITNFNDSLTLVNPAFMTRQLAELSKANGTSDFHITSLNPIRPANKADEWENKALQMFKNPDDKFFEKVDAGDSVVFRYMAPLVTGQSCLACHASQGYKLGDIRGGISVNTSYRDKDLVMARAGLNKIIIIHVLIFFIGLFFILYFHSAAKKRVTPGENRNGDLQESDHVKDKFYNIVAHDLKTPAVNMLFLSEALKNRYAELSTGEQKEYVDMLYESARTQNNLLNNLLDLSRLWTGNMQCHPKSLDVCSLIDEVLDQTKLQSQQKKINVVNKADSCCVFADANMMRTVLRNIIVNAIKFSYPGSEVIIRTRENQGKIIISVADTGIGIKENMKDKIFTSDHNKTMLGTEKETGTGLGLTLSKEFIEYNKGEIWFESEFGVGTTFFISLPMDGDMGCEL